MAPEIITGTGHIKTVDFYCLGALLYEMLIGFPPFYDPSLS
jgi:protein kinase A